MGSKVWEHYALPYEWETTHYHKTYVDQIGQAVSEFPCVNRFANIDINEQVRLLTETNQNISNYIPRKTIIYEDKNWPWIDEEKK